MGKCTRNVMDKLRRAFSLWLDRGAAALLDFWCQHMEKVTLLSK